MSVAPPALTTDLLDEKKLGRFSSVVARLL